MPVVSAFEATTVVMSMIAQLLAIGWQYHQAGDYRQAEQLYRYALSANPDDAQAHCCLGMLLASETRLDDAAASYRRANALKPDFAESHNNLGRIFLRQGNDGDAVHHFKEAARLRPDHAEIHCNLGIVLQRLDRLEEAEMHCRHALRIRPDYPEAHHVLAAALLKLNHLDEAVAHWREVVRMRPDFALAHNNLGCVLLRQGQPESALECFQQAIRSQPDLDEAHANLLFCLNYLSEIDAASVFEQHSRWGQIQEIKHHAERAVYSGHLASRDADPERRLRIGYVSPDLRRHALARYFEPVLANHDPQHFEVFCYAEVQTPDAVTGRLQCRAQGWRNTCGFTDAEVAERILGDRIDILVDLAGHTSNSRLLVFARKPAPVQVTWLGYMNTTGLHTIDYRLTDAWLDPPGQPVLDTEELFRLPTGMSCFAPPPEALPVGPLPALQCGHLTFGSLHGLSKVNSRVIDTWCKLLQAMPTARLLMFRDTLTGECENTSFANSRSAVLAVGGWTFGRVGTCQAF